MPFECFKEVRIVIVLDPIVNQKTVVDQKDFPAFGRQSCRLQHELEKPNMICMIFDCMVARNSAKHSSLLSDLVAR